MKKQDKFLLIMLFGVAAFELGPPLWDKFEEQVLNQRPRDPHLLTELIRRYDSPSSYVEIGEP